MNRRIDLLLDLTAQPKEQIVIRNTLESLVSCDRLGEIVSSATVLLPAKLCLSYMPAWPDWRLIPTSEPITAANEAFQNASQDNHHLLVLLGPILPEKEALQVLAKSLSIDPYFGIIVPRQFDPVTGEILKLSNELGDPRLATLPRCVLARAPEYYILPDLLCSCFLVRDSIVSNFNFLDETYKTLAGAFQHYLCRTRRCGFRCAVINRAAVSRAPDSVSCLVPVARNDMLRLHVDYPDAGLAKTEFALHPLHVHESLLGRALSMRQEVRETLLIDIRGVSSKMDGTVEAVLALCDALYQRSHWAITLLADRGPTEFHKLAERYRNWEIIHEERDHYFTAALRPSQPWDISSMMDLHHMALFNFYSMLDTIVWDIVFAAPRGLGGTWEFLSAYADGILYISQYTRDRFAARFPLSRVTPGYVSYLSFHPDDYQVAITESEPGEQEDFILVVGNAYDHKDVEPTVDLLSSAFPFYRISALGLKRQASRLVDALQSGQIPQADVDRLFARANVIVFPSFYEGFGFPILKGLSSGRTVVARHSELVFEIASRYRGPGRLVTFRNRMELIDAIGRVIHNSQVTEVPLGTALDNAEQPMSWKEVAAGVLQFIEKQAQHVDRSRWHARQNAIEQLIAYSNEGEKDFPL